MGKEIYILAGNFIVMENLNMERSYKGLALQQDQITGYIEQFLQENVNVKVREDVESSNKRAIKFGFSGVNDALVILHFMRTGLTTVQYNQGKNQPLGKTFADYLFETVNPEENITINLSIRGIDEDDLIVLIDDLAGMVDGEQPEFELTHRQPSERQSIHVIESTKYKDKLTVTHHKTTNVLQIQGRPLFTYRNLTFSLSILLDQEALLSVISKTSAEEQLLVRQDVAKNHIEKEFVNSYARMPNVFKDLLISSYCVKLAAPNLPEYSMLLYADLRVLEGVIKQALLVNGQHTDTKQIDIGSYFEFSYPASWAVKEEYWKDFDCQETMTALEECYQLFNIQRHSLFHLNEIADSSRIISTIGNVLELSSDIAEKIENLYLKCQKL